MPKPGAVHGLPLQTRHEKTQPSPDGRLDYSPLTDLETRSLYKTSATDLPRFDVELRPLRRGALTSAVVALRPAKRGRR